MSEAQRYMAIQITGARLPAPVLEFRFNPERRYRADFAWPSYMLILEIEGGTWIKGRHVTGTGFQEDIYKYNSMVLLGYRVLRATTQDVNSGIALQTLEAALRIPVADASP